MRNIFYFYNNFVNYFCKLFSFPGMINYISISIKMYCNISNKDDLAGWLQSFSYFYFAYPKNRERAINRDRNV